MTKTQNKSVKCGCGQVFNKTSRGHMYCSYCEKAMDTNTSTEDKQRYYYDLLKLKQNQKLRSVVKILFKQLYDIHYSKVVLSNVMSMDSNELTKHINDIFKRNRLEYMGENPALSATVYRLSELRNEKIDYEKAIQLLEDNNIDYEGNPPVGLHRLPKEYSDCGCYVISGGGYQVTLEDNTLLTFNAGGYIEGGPLRKFSWVKK